MNPIRFQQRGQVLKTREYCGDTKNELSKYGPSAFIKKFITTGAKSYGYVAEYIDNRGRVRNHLTIMAKGIHTP